MIVVQARKPIRWEQIQLKLHEDLEELKYIFKGDIYLNMQIEFPEYKLVSNLNEDRFKKLTLIFGCLRGKLKDSELLDKLNMQFIPHVEVTLCSYEMEYHREQKDIQFKDEKHL